MILTDDSKQMETKMKEICAGSKTRGDVVHESLDMYRDVYIRTRRGINILKAVSSITQKSNDEHMLMNGGTVGRQICAGCRRQQVMRNTRRVQSKKQVQGRSKCSRKE